MIHRAETLRSIDRASLYGIVDLGYVPRDQALAMTLALALGGVDILQLRAKRQSEAEVESLAQEMLKITREHGVPLVINDHPRVAANVGSEGVHVGQDDGPLTEVRSMVGPSMIIGRSTHSVTQARAAMAEGADYIGFGPLFATGTKPDYVPIGLADIGEVHGFATVPVFCIGGVNLERLDAIVSAGARRVVIVSALLLAQDIPAYVHQAKEKLKRGAAGALDGLRAHAP